MRDLTPATRGAMPATPAAWQRTADELTVLRAIVVAEREIYGSVTPTTAAILAEQVATVEAAVVIDAAQQSARRVDPVAREALRLRRLAVLAAMVGREPLDAAWQAWADDVPMNWLPIDHYGPAARSGRDAYDDAARRAGPGVL